MKPRNRISLAYEVVQDHVELCHGPLVREHFPVVSLLPWQYPEGAGETMDSVVPFPSVSSDRVDETVRQTFQKESQGLTEIPENLDLQWFEQAVIALMIARRIYCYGIDVSAPLASEAERNFVGLGLRCFAIQDPIQMAIQTTLLTPKDVVIVFSHTSRCRQTLDGLALAYNAGATTICIAAQKRAALMPFTDIPLMLATRHRRGGGPSSKSRIAELILVRALASCVALRQGPLSARSAEVEQGIEKVAASR